MSENVSVDVVEVLLVRDVDVCHTGGVISHANCHPKWLDISSCPYWRPSLRCGISGGLNLASLAIAADRTFVLWSDIYPKQTWTKVILSDRQFLIAKQVVAGLPVCSDVLSFCWRRRSCHVLTALLLSNYVFVYRGNKPANSPKGHPPDADGHSSVTDLANSLTGDMVMVRHPSKNHSSFSFLDAYELTQSKSYHCWFFMLT